MAEWLQDFPACSVMSAANHLMNMITGSYDSSEAWVVGETVNTLEVTHRIKIVFEKKFSEDGRQKFVINTQPYSYEKIAIDIPNTVEPNMSMEQSTEAIIKGLEQMQLVDFENDKYNNELFVNAVSEGIKFANKIGINKWLNQEK